MPSPTVIIVSDAFVKFGPDEADVGPEGTGTSYECQVTSAAVNANPNLQSVPATFCSPASQAPAATGWELALTWLQDWTAEGGGLSFWAYENDTLEMWFSVSLTAEDEPIVVGQLRVVAGSFGGDAATPLTASGTWPCVNKPLITPVAVAP